MLREDMICLLPEWIGAYGFEPCMVMMALTTSGLTVVVTQLSR
ncbi:hypothetical protein ATSB10_32380 [Dyella thiooxydans]|uniref:Uncharacterized protein n=1 Tax=Dyella thiooxydans TaxID=445710 RepID=A0A160N565_9GAMM|nr:hypothetical protein ATSB10_32380 [Dyella thiooxydans]